MDRCASGKTQGFKSLKCFNITDPTKCKDKLLWDKSDRDKISSLPVVEPSTDSWEDPILQVVAIFIILYRVDLTFLLIFKGGPLARARRTTFWAPKVKPKPNLSDLYGISGSWPHIVHPPSSITALASFKDDILSGGLVIFRT